MNDFIFDFSEDYILEDERVILRPLQHEDWKGFLDISINEPETWYYSLVGAAGEENLKNYIAIALQNRQNKIEYPFTVIDKQTNEFAGCTRFYDLNFPFQSLQLGYTWYGKKFRGTGLNKHCKYLLLQFAFEKMLMERFELRADNNNERSIAAMKSIGCKVDGILRGNMPSPYSQKRRDSIVLSILKEEWFTEVKSNLGKNIYLGS